MPVRIIANTGQLPRFWNRGAIFFSNLRSLFFGNEAQTKVLEDEVRGVPTYGGRLVSILNLLYRSDKNLIFLEALPNQPLLEYLGNGLGIPLPEMELLSQENYVHLGGRLAGKGKGEDEPFINRLRVLSAEWIDGYVTDSILADIARNSGKSTISSFDGSKKGNNKFLLHHHLLEKGLPAFETVFAFSSREITSCLKQLRDKGYNKAVFKSQIGASGCGLIKSGMEGFQPEDIPEYLFFEGPCLVQGWLDEDIFGVRKVGSPSVQMFLNEEECFLYDITEQFLKDDSIHEGNTSPPPYLGRRPEIREELLAQASVAGAWLHGHGYRGTASTDFLVIEKNGKPEVIICEVNARVTGATYPAILARNFLPGGAWVMRNLMFHPPLECFRLLDDLKRFDLLYLKGHEKGVLPFNFNMDEQGMAHKGQFVFLAPSPGECEELLQKIQTVFPWMYRFDRD